MKATASAAGLVMRSSKRVSPMRFREVPFTREKMRYDDSSGMVIYRSRLHATLKRNYQLMPALKWLRMLMNHIPDKYEHLVRYYGYYSNRSRGARRTAEQNNDTPASVVIDEAPANAQRKASWARLIQKVVAPGHPWPPRHWHFPLRRTKSIRSSAPAAAAPCASSHSSTMPVLLSASSGT